MTPPRRRLRIDWVAVEQARLARGLTHPELATRVGATAPYASYRLWLDDDHDNIRLGVLERLCEVLDLEPAELFTPRRSRRRDRHTPGGTAAATDPATDPAASTQDPETATRDGPAGHHPAATAATAGAADMATAGAAIAALPAPVTHDKLADALEWPLARLLAATALLEDHLEAAGTRLHTDDHRIHGIEPRHALLNSTQRQALHQAGVATTTLDEAAARMLYTVAELEQRRAEPEHAGDNPAAVQLQNQGLLRRRAPATNLAVTDDVRYSLMLDEHPTEITLFLRAQHQQSRPRHDGHRSRPRSIDP